MKKKVGILLVLAAVLMAAIFMTLSKGICEASRIHLDAIGNENVKLVAQVCRGQLTCMVDAAGRTDTKRISGVLTVKDKTSGKTVATWNISVNGRRLSETKMASVTRGHAFSISFTGAIEYSSGKSTFLKSCNIQ